MVLRNHKRDPVILIADDNEQNLQILINFVREMGYVIVVARSGPEILSALKMYKADLILLDALLADIDGYDICERIKHNPETEDIPVIFLTEKAEPEDIALGFRVGAVDYVTTPYSQLELKARIQTHLELYRTRRMCKFHNRLLEDAHNELQEAYEVIKEKNVQLYETMKKLEIAARTDPLTNLLNRRSMMERIEEEMVRFKRSGREFSLILADIDFFKNVNDSYGHDCGDFVLVTIAEALKNLMRDQDSISRWGGEEFLILMPETDSSGALTISEKIRECIESLPLKYNDITLYLTITLGISVYEHNSEIDTTILNADRALYRGKERGRNQVNLFEHFKR